MKQRRKPKLHPSLTHKQARLIRSQLTGFVSMTQLAALPEEQQIGGTDKETKGPSGALIQFLRKDLKLVLDAIQRVSCLVLAIWWLPNTRNLWEFVAILAVSYIDPHAAKDVLVRVLRATVTGGR